jgi:hypothetical protein
MPILRRCLGCRVLCETPRCPPCRTIYERQHTQRKRAVRPYTPAEQQRRAAAVASWVALNGWSCPGWRRPPHAAEVGSLTADHPTAVAAGGEESQPLDVLCRSCNGAKAARAS